MALRFVKTRSGRLSPLATGICVALAAFTVFAGPAQARHWRHYHYYARRQAAPAANPAFAIISVGTDNSYGHPNRDVLDRLGEHHAEVLRTDRNGLVTVRTDGRHLTVETHW